ncbi:hypothetical protein TNCV_2202731 [Trichonephila clavipes]|nr:hypothetical protein TNCV_2202731 [Trichonephila clavipes]
MRDDQRPTATVSGEVFSLEFKGNLSEQQEALMVAHLKLMRPVAQKHVLHRVLADGEHILFLEIDSTVFSGTSYHSNSYFCLPRLQPSDGWVAVA